MLLTDAPRLATDLLHKKSPIATSDQTQPLSPNMSAPQGQPLQYEAPYPAMTSAMNILALLDEQQVDVKAHAIRSLVAVVDFFWHEIADVIPKIEQLARDPAFVQHQIASLLLAKVYFHLSKYDESVDAALKAGEHFDIDEQSGFAETILARAIDKYVALRVDNEENPKDLPFIDPALEAIVERMVERCVGQGQHKQALGIGLEARRIDILEGTLSHCPSDQTDQLLQFVQHAALKLVRSRAFQLKVLKCVISIAQTQPAPDWVFICDCLVSVEDPERCGLVLSDLVAKAAAGDEDAALVALQIAFNLYDDATQEFVQKTVASLSAKAKETDQLIETLSGKRSIQLRLEFLGRANHSDLLILDRTKETLNAHNSLHHSGLTFANALSQAGTTNDEFLRKNLEWLSFATNWSKFSAASGLGTIHKGQLVKSRTILEPYLPKDGVSTSQYSEGGALFALGLIHANHADQAEIDYLLKHLSTSPSEIIQHGACLGLGAAAMASRNLVVLEQVKSTLYGDNAVAGEAAAIAIGLVMLGSGSADLIEELLHYAHETNHEKIIRGLALALALIVYGLRSDADSVIDQMSLDKDPIVRYGAMWAIAMAYAGTSDNSAIRRLLHAAVSESNDDVRRAAVASLGFVLFKNRDELPRLVELLTESYNPHVRYGAALALGIAFAGTGSRMALDLIRPLTKDLSDFARQGAFIAIALVLQQTSDTANDQVSSLRKLFETVAHSKYEDVLARFGAILAQGLIDAGGRNSVLSLSSPIGHNSMSAIVGTMLFCQFWYWYPMIHFVSLALFPTAIIGVSRDLKVPKFSLECACKPSLFAYPAPLKPATTAAPKKLVTAVLSTTAKAVARAKKAGKAEDTDQMDVDEPTMDVDVPSSSPEPTSFLIDNSSRVTAVQRGFVRFSAGSRFVPVAFPWRGGIAVLRDLKPSEPIELINPKEAKGVQQEPSPPEPFEAPEI